MFTVSVETNFWASHKLTLQDGSKEPLHSHNFSIIADVGSENLSNLGVVMDFRRLKMMLDNIVAEFDNLVLDNIDYFRTTNSTAENVAKYIYGKLQPQLPEGVKLQAVRVAEEPGCSVKFDGKN
jgi:6-pyruvoyltetrahydropterin/6-carboxytetrahydropterin synthase